MSDAYEWRRQAVSLGVGGALPERDSWLKPLFTSIAAGRSDELGARALQMQRRWERNGRIIHRPLPEQHHDVLDALLKGRRFAIDVASGGEAPPSLLQCSEAECATW